MSEGYFLLMGYINVAMDQHAQGIDLKRASEPQG